MSAATLRYLRPAPPSGPCSACQGETVYRDRETGARLCAGCLGQWARLRRLGWTGRPAEVGRVEWVAVPREWVA